MEFMCPSRARVAEIKLLNSCDDPGKPFYNCNECGKFVNWAKPMEDRRRVLGEENHASMPW